MPKKIMRYLIPSDETEITFGLTGAIRFVTHNADGIIECYAEAYDDAPTQYITLRVLDNGKSIPDYFGYVDSVSIGKNVKHLYIVNASVDVSDWNKEQWTPTSTNDDVVESVPSLDTQLLPKYDETDPDPSQ